MVKSALDQSLLQFVESYPRGATGHKDSPDKKAFGSSPTNLELAVSIEEVGFPDDIS